MEVATGKGWGAVGLQGGVSRRSGRRCRSVAPPQSPTTPALQALLAPPQQLLTWDQAPASGSLPSQGVPPSLNLL